MPGRAYGTSKEGFSPASAFIDDEGGYTTVAVALALLLAVTLTLFAGRVQWSLSRAAEVQHVADAASTAGANVVARYATCAQAVDAIILTMGLAGIITCGASLVLACVPGAGAAAAQVLETGTSILDARSAFARSAVEGLDALEKAVPVLVVLGSVASVHANSTDIAYTGAAVPFPLTGSSSFSVLDTDIDTERLEQHAQELKQKTDALDQAKQRADEALVRGWMADCGASPRCMRERAATLAGLAPAQNPHYPSADTWSFGAALLRARTYYPVRLATDAPEYGTVEAMVDSCARRAFYGFAVEKMSSARYIEHADGSVDISLPELPRNTSQMRDTRLYTDVTWPCTAGEDGRVLHASLECPGATQPPSGYASLAQLDDGAVGMCPTCQMDATDMGRVAAASTSIDNGFEHYWREVVLASRDYMQARNECARLEGSLRESAKGGLEGFEEALEALKVPRPELSPPGAQGVVAIVARVENETVPQELGATFLDAASLPGGVAVSAAMLAPDESGDANSVLAHLFDGIVENNPALLSVLGDAGSLWGAIIESYGSAYEGIARTSSDFISRIDGVFGGSVGAWVQENISDAIRDAGLAPADIRMLKPVLVSSADVLERSGAGGVARIQQIVLALGPAPSMQDVLALFGAELKDALPEKTITLGEIPIPGTGLSILLEVDLSKLVDALWGG